MIQKKERTSKMHALAIFIESFIKLLLQLLRKEFRQKLLCAV